MYWCGGREPNHPTRYMYIEITGELYEICIFVTFRWMRQHLTWCVAMLGGLLTSSPQLSEGAGFSLWTGSVYTCTW